MYIQRIHVIIFIQWHRLTHWPPINQERKFINISMAWHTCTCTIVYTYMHYGLCMRGNRCRIYNGNKSPLASVFCPSYWHCMYIHRILLCLRISNINFSCLHFPYRKFVQWILNGANVLNNSCCFFFFVIVYYYYYYL